LLQKYAIKNRGFY